VLELQRARLNRTAALVLGLASLGFAVGVPVGLVYPTALVYALASYGSAVAALAIGYGERLLPGGPFTLRTALLFVVPALAVYGIAQYFLLLTPWDAEWLRSSVDYVSVGSPEEGRVRIFSTLNGPGVFAPVLAMSLMTVLAARRLGGLQIPLALLLTVALALTFVRSAWLALLVAVILYAGAARGRAVGRLVTVIAICLAAAVGLSSTNPTAAAFVERVSTFGDLDQDTSARARLALSLDIVPGAVAQPLGHGLGQAGQASTLVDRLDRRLRTPDQVENAFDRPILGSVPETRALKTKRDPGAASTNGSSPVDESFRMLRANLLYFNIDRDVGSVLITSAAVGRRKDDRGAQPRGGRRGSRQSSHPGRGGPTQANRGISDGDRHQRCRGQATAGARPSPRDVADLREGLDQGRCSQRPRWCRGRQSRRSTGGTVAAERGRPDRVVPHAKVARSTRRAL